MAWGKPVGIVLLFFALGLGPLLRYLKALGRTPMDPQLGHVELHTPEELGKAFINKRTLVVGGTRGIGRGVARAIAEAGGDLTIVGRSPESGASAVAHLKAHANSSTQQIVFFAGDLGTAKSAKTLVRWLEEAAKTQGKYDNLVVTAAVFPDWKELLNEDGLEKGHAIAVVGRYTLYRHMHRFLKDGGRVLNVLASGDKMARFERDLLTGQRNCTGLVECVLNWGSSSELMQIGVQESGKFKSITRVSTNPGFLRTELHSGQGLIVDLLEPVVAALIGISEDDCGVRQASILASERLPKGQLSYVDEDMIGRTRSSELQTLADDHLLWLMAWLNERTEL
jgi:hypothetical protein